MASAATHGMYSHCSGDSSQLRPSRSLGADPPNPPPDPPDELSVPSPADPVQPPVQPVHPPAEIPPAFSAPAPVAPPVDGSSKLGFRSTWPPQATNTKMGTLPSAVDDRMVVDWSNDKATGI